MPAWFPHPLILTGKKVQLVPLEKKHFGELIELAKDKRIWEFMPVDWLGKKDLKTVLHEALSLRDSGQQYPFVVIDRKTKKIIGSTRYLKINPAFRNLEIGWTWYTPKYWGSGYNKECKFLLLQHCFEELKTICVYLGTSEKNIRSQKAMESIGAKYEGTSRNRLVWNRKKISFVIYSITDDEWPEVKNDLIKAIRRK